MRQGTISFFRMYIAAAAWGMIIHTPPVLALEPTPEACRSGYSADDCAAIYERGYRITCFENGKPTFEGEAWMMRDHRDDPLPYVQMDGQPVEPLWQRYGACKLRREG
jgi:hypothetical protein